MRLNHLFTLIIGLILILSSALSVATPVNVVAAKISEIFPTAWVSGSVISNNDAQIASQVQGRLIYVAPVGQNVKRGDVIAKIDDTEIALRVKELQATVANVKRNYQFLVGEVRRIQELTKKNLSAKNDLDQSMANRDMAKATMAQEQARLEQMQIRLSYSQILAPFNGVVKSRLSQLGEVVDNGTTVIQLVETANLEVTAQVPLTTYNFLQQGGEVEVTSALGQAKAKIRAVVPVADARSHLMELRLTLLQTQWPVGLSVRVAAPSGKTEKLLVVPRDAIVLRREGNAIFKIDGENKAQRVAVELGIASGSVIAISGDVSAGDKVVIRGSERLQPGQTVVIKDNNEALVSLQH